MGFFDRFKKEEVIEEKETNVELSLEQMEPWLSEQFGNKMSEAMDYFKNISSEIMVGIRKMVVSLNDLEKIKFTADDRINSKVNMIKNDFVTQSRSSLSAVNGPKENTYNEYRKFLVATRKVLNEAAKANRKQRYILSTYFKADGKPFSQAFQKTNERLDTLRDSLNKKYNFLEGVEKARIKSETVVKSQKQCTFLKNRLKEAALKTKETKNSKGRERKQLDELKKSERCNAVKKLEDEIRDIEKDIEATEKELTSVHSVSRILKKMAHKTGEKNVIKLAESPKEEFKSLSKEKIQDIFKSAERAVNNNELDIKESDKKHMVYFMQNLPVLLEKRDKMEDKKKMMKKKQVELESTDIIKNTQKIETTIRLLEKELATLGEEKISTEKEIEKLEKNIIENKKQIEEILTKQGYVVKLRI